MAPPQCWYIRGEGESFDLDFYATYDHLFSINLHYGGKFTESPNKQYVDGESCFVDLVDINEFKIPLKSLDVGLHLVVSDGDINSKNFIAYVKDHKVMDFYVELIEKTDSSSDGDSGNESANEHDLVDEEHLVEEVEVNMDGFDFHLDVEDETAKVNPVEPHVNITEEDLEVIDFDSLDSDQDDVRSKGLRKLRKKNSGSCIRNNFYIGKEFSNRDIAKDRIRAHAVETRRNLDIKVNDKRRIRVVCNGVVPTVSTNNVVVDKVEGLNQGTSEKGKVKMQDSDEDKNTCPWVLYLSKGDKSKWVVKTFKNEHKCLQSRNIKHCTSTFLSKQIADLITMNPKISIKALQEHMQKKYHVKVSKHKAFRAKAKAELHLKGDVEIQYTLLRDYANELQRCNPDTTVKIDVYGEDDPEKTTRMFRRIYVCLGALKKGFKESGRELLGLDGAFMRGQYSGQMLTAVGVDANNGIYPVAYGIVESENQYSWTWFLKCLGDDFDLHTNSNFTFITDRQKGLVPTIAKLFPAAEHRFCVRHIYENMNMTWKGEDYKEMLWKCATSTTVVRFQKNMDDLKNYNKKAHEWLSKIPPEHWSRAFFSGMCTYLLAKTRKKSKGELEMVKGHKLTRKGKTVTCSNCHGVGHNKRGCKNIGSSGGQIFDMTTRDPVESQSVASQHDERRPVIKKSANKRPTVEASQSSQAVSQSSQPASQPSGLESPMKRTKLSACRLNPGT